MAKEFRMKGKEEPGQQTSSAY